MNIYSKQNMYLMIFGISLFLIILHFYNKENDKDVIEGFSTMDNIKTILKFPFVILKFIVMILKLPCMLVNFLGNIIDKVL